MRQLEPPLAVARGACHDDVVRPVTAASGDWHEMIDGVRLPEILGAPVAPPVLTGVLSRHVGAAQATGCGFLPGSSCLTARPAFRRRLTGPPLSRDRIPTGRAQRAETALEDGKRGGRLHAAASGALLDRTAVDDLNGETRLSEPRSRKHDSGDTALTRRPESFVIPLFAGVGCRPRAVTGVTGSLESISAATVTVKRGARLRFAALRATLGRRLVEHSDLHRGATPRDAANVAGAFLRPPFYPKGGC